MSTPQATERSQAPPLAYVYHTSTKSGGLRLCVCMCVCLRVCTTLHLAHPLSLSLSLSVCVRVCVFACVSVYVSAVWLWRRKRKCPIV
jgi:hypothetical protein